MENYKITVYVDMDGVLANFEKRFYEISGGKEAVNTDNQELWNIIETYGKAKFFSELPPMSGALEMWKFIKNNFLNVKILSALGKSDKIDKQTSQGKVAWLRHHIPDLAIDDIILVDNKHRKRHYSKPGDIMIDDTLVVIQEWTKKGGIGILHKSSKETMNILEKYI